MKKLLLLFVAVIFLFSCEEKQVFIDELVKRGGIYYFESKPYVGFVVDVYKNGQLNFKSNYKNGKKNGLDRWYFESGGIRKEGNWKDDKQEGLWKFYDENGKVKAEGNYENNKRQGLWKSYDENGKLKKSQKWKNNSPIYEDDINTYVIEMGADITKDDVEGLLVGGEIITIKDLRKSVKQFIDNNREKAIISLQINGGASYEIYMSVQNELSTAYKELRNEAALQKYNLTYAELPKAKKKEIKKMYPIKISETTK